MSFCVAGVVICDIPTCLITCQTCQNWKKSRTKRSFCCAHVSRLEHLVFPWRCRICGKLQNLCLCLSSGVVVSMGEAAKPRLFCCAHVAVSIVEAAKPQSLFVLWRRRVYGGSCKTLFWRRRVYGGSCKTSVSACPLTSPLSMGKAAKLRSFCCAHVAVFFGEAAKPQSLLHSSTGNVLCKLCSAQ